MLLVGLDKLADVIYLIHRISVMQKLPHHHHYFIQQLLRIYICT